MTKYQQEKERIKAEYKSKIKELRSNKETLKEKVLDKAKEWGADLADEYVDKIEEDFKKKRKKLQVIYLAKMKMVNSKEVAELAKISSKNKMILAGVIIASGIIYASITAYHERKKVSIQYCKGKVGKEEKICLLKYEKNNLQKRLTFLRSQIFRCKYSKDPVKCKLMIDKEILKVEEKLEKFKEDLGVHIGAI